jgi:hypothetical protein
MNRLANQRTEKFKDAIRSTSIIIILLIIFASMFASLFTSFTYALPSGPQVLYNNTETAPVREATEIITAGGSFTTILLNATTQTPRWKAYAGNVSGRLVLDDSINKSIYDWTLSSVTGEVYATRNASISWAGIACADRARLITEETSLNMSSGNADTINKTFVNQKHRSFYVGAVLIQNSTCPSVATYINDAAQTVSENAVFQEVILKDSASSVIFASLINQSVIGFNGQRYDFQMIVPENEYAASPTPYYLYVELV